MIVSTDHSGGRQNAEGRRRNAESSFTHHASRITPHALTHHASRVTCHAFTLLELLTVITIMGIVAALVRADAPGPQAQCQGGGHPGVARRRGPRPPACHRPPHHRLYGLPAHQLLGSGGGGRNWTNVQPLLDKQLTGYAYVSLRSVGDQPGVNSARYLSSWKTLPKGAFIPLQKFSTGFMMTNIF